MLQTFLQYVADYWILVAVVGVVAYVLLRELSLGSVGRKLNEAYVRLIATRTTYPVAVTHEDAA